MLLFSASDQHVDWKRAAYVRSRHHVGSVFQDVDEMIRAIINLNEAYEGQLVPEILKPTMNQKVLLDRVDRLFGKVGGNLIAASIGLVK